MEIRVHTKTIAVRKRTGLWSGIVRNEPGMVGNDFLEKLLGIADYDNNQWGPLGGLVFEGHKDSTVPLATCSAWRTIRSQSMT